MATHTLEARFEIWNDSSGERIEVGEDRDGLDLVEIRSIADDNTCGPSITLPEEAVPALIEGLQRLMKFREERKPQSK